MILDTMDNEKLTAKKVRKALGSVPVTVAHSEPDYEDRKAQEERCVTEALRWPGTLLCLTLMKG